MPPQAGVRRRGLPQEEPYEAAAVEAGEQQQTPAWDCDSSAGEQDPGEPGDIMACLCPGGRPNGKVVFLLLLFLLEVVMLAASSHHNSSRLRSMAALDERDMDEDNCVDSQLTLTEPNPVWGCEELEALWEERDQNGLEIIGHGYWRDVYEGHYEGHHIVYKHMKDKHSRTARNTDRHRREAVALQATADSPYVVPLLGYCDSEVVTPYMPGALEDLLFEDYHPEDMPMERVLLLALQAARGVHALHSAPGGLVVHADLQPRQFLFDSAGVLRINDLNRCRLLKVHAPSGGTCPFRTFEASGVWRAPEEFAMLPLDEKIDIYSLGLILHALASGRPPFIRADDYKTAVLAGDRPPVDPAWPPAYIVLMQQMWAPRASARPTSGEVVARLEAMVADYHAPAAHAAATAVHRLKVAA